MTDTLLHKGNLISLYKEQVDLRDGGHTHFDIVKHPGGAVIAAINSNDELCLLKQWRHAVGEHIWELPAGCLEPNEPPLETAKRELEEEAGVKASTWKSFGDIIPSPGFCNERLYLFLATDISQGTVKLDDAEQLEAHWIAIDKVKQMAVDGEIKDAKTFALLFKLVQHLNL